MAKKKKPAPAARIVAESDDLQHVFRAIVDQSGMTRYAIAQEIGVAESTLSRAYTGTGGVPWHLLQSVAKAVGVRVVVRVEG